MSTKKRAVVLTLTAITTLGLSAALPAGAQPVDPECVSLPTGGTLPERRVDVKGACSMPCIFACDFSNPDHDTMECKDRRGNNTGRGVAPTLCPPGFQKVQRSGVFVCVKPATTCPDARPPFSITNASVRDSATQSQARSEVLYRPVSTPLQPGMCAQGGSDGFNLVFFRGPGLERATSTSVGQLLDPSSADVRAEGCAVGCRAVSVRLSPQTPDTLSITLGSPDGRSTARTFKVVDGMAPRVEKCAPLGPRVVSCPAGRICR